MHDTSFNGQSWSRRWFRYAAPPIGLTKKLRSFASLTAPANFRREARHYALP